MALSILFGFILFKKRTCEENDCVRRESGDWLIDQGSDPRPAFLHVIRNPPYCICEADVK